MLIPFVTNFLTDPYPPPLPPINFLCGRKPEKPEKVHDFWHRIDELFPPPIKGALQRKLFEKDYN